MMIIEVQHIWFLHLEIIPINCTKLLLAKFIKVISQFVYVFNLCMKNLQLILKFKKIMQSFNLNITRDNSYNHIQLMSRKPVWLDHDLEEKFYEVMQKAQQKIKAGNGPWLGGEIFAGATFWFEEIYQKDEELPMFQQSQRSSSPPPQQQQRLSQSSSLQKMMARVKKIEEDFYEATPIAFRYLLPQPLPRLQRQEAAREAEHALVERQAQHTLQVNRPLEEAPNELRHPVDQPIIFRPRNIQVRRNFRVNNIEWLQNSETSEQARDKLPNQPSSSPSFQHMPQFRPQPQPQPHLESRMPTTDKAFSFLGPLKNRKK